MLVLHSRINDKGFGVQSFALASSGCSSKWGHGREFNCREGLLTFIFKR